MNDRELLELAAKAVGYRTDSLMNRERLTLDPPVAALWVTADGKLVHTGWNPLDDDGDALRLAVKLQLTVVNEHISAGVAYCTKSVGACAWAGPDCHSGSHEPDVIPADYSATRRAIVLAAAEIGREPS